MTHTEPEPVDFDGCRRSCRLAGAHTLVRGECEHAPEPEPTVSMSVVFDDTDGHKSIGFDTYTVQQLAELLEPALRRVTVRLGPNSLAMLERGEPVGLSGGEYADLAREAAHAIVHRNDDTSAVSAGQAPAADQSAEAVCMCGHLMSWHHEDVCLLEGCGCNDGREPEEPTTPSHRAGLRDDIADAMREHYLCTSREEADADGNMPCRCGDWREPGPMGSDEDDWDSHLADAVLAVLPTPGPSAADWDALCREGGRLRKEAAELVDRAERIEGDVQRLGDVRAALLAELIADAEECDGHITVQELRRLAGEPHTTTQADEAHPPTSTWKVESPRRDQWASWGATYDDRDWAQERYESAAANASARPFRLVRATTTYTVEAEHVPAAVVQAAAPDTGAETGRIVGYRFRYGRSLRCLAHPPFGLDSGNYEPVTSEDLPDGGTCTFTRHGEECGVDVLIPQQPAVGRSAGGATDTKEN